MEVSEFEFHLRKISMIVGVESGRIQPWGGNRPTREVFDLPLADEDQCWRNFIAL